MKAESWILFEAFGLNHPLVAEGPKILRKISL